MFMGCILFSFFGNQEVISCVHVSGHFKFFLKLLLLPLACSDQSSLSPAILTLRGFFDYTLVRSICQSQFLKSGLKDYEKRLEISFVDSDHDPHGISRTQLDEILRPAECIVVSSLSN